MAELGGHGTDPVGIPFDLQERANRGLVDLDLLLGMTMFAVALAVAAVPEALAAIVTGALAIGMHSMAKRNALVKRMPAVETLGSTTVICTDKTGTLTRGEMTIRRILCGTKPIEVTGAGYVPEGELRLPNDLALDDRMLQLLLQGGVLCNDSELLQESGRWAIRGDPTEAAFLVLAAKGGVDPGETRADCVVAESSVLQPVRPQAIVRQAVTAMSFRILEVMSGLLAWCDRARSRRKVANDAVRNGLFVSV